MGGQNGEAPASEVMTDEQVAKEMAKPPAQKPSVGRIVHFEPDPARIPDGERPKGQPYAAVITHVWSDTCVNLAVHQDGSFYMGDLYPTSVNLGTGPRTWSWPPRV